MAQTINENDLAQWIKDREGGRQKCTIAQVKEVQRHLLDVLGEHMSIDPVAVFELIWSHGKGNPKTIAQRLEDDP